jgi:hypothetical protein
MICSGHYLSAKFTDASASQCYAALRDYALPILNILVPQVVHSPVVAGLPFFIVVATGFLISCLDLHLTQ